jgi:hypothetical protein
MKERAPVVCSCQFSRLSDPSDMRKLSCPVKVIHILLYTCRVEEKLQILYEAEPGQFV